jgi:hypothetical protein
VAGPEAILPEPSLTSGPSQAEEDFPSIDDDHVVHSTGPVSQIPKGVNNPIVVPYCKQLALQGDLLLQRVVLARKLYQNLRQVAKAERALRWSSGN